MKGAYSDLRAAVPGVVCLALLSGCSSLSSPNSPDVVYSKTASEARTLQVPPDLTDVSNAEQFVLPGTGNAAITRNTLLPQFDTVRFVREGGQSWLEFQLAPEELWPQLLLFVRKEKYVVDQTEPVAGVIATRWRPNSAVATTNLLRNLVAGADQYTRIAFRMERAGGGTRLFARSQVADEDVVNATRDAGDASWPVSSHDPENTNALLNRFLVFLGVEQQRARGILGAEEVSAILDDAVVQSNAGGSEMLIQRGFQTSYQQVLAALQALEYSIVSTDDNVGRIEFSDEATPLVVALSPIHVSAVRVSLTNVDGGRLPPDKEQELLSALAQQIS